MRFSKYHGTGNDFVLIEDLGDAAPVPPPRIAAICDRHLGVGADGLIRIVRGADAGADFFMDYWNADGSVAEMCGNGIRCLAKHVVDRGLAAGATTLRVATRAGLKTLELDLEDGEVSRVTVDMGSPAFERRTLPMRGDPVSTFVGEPWEAAGRTFSVATALSMGNPHLVVFLGPDEDLGGLDVPGLGAAIERSPAFPNGTNVEFVRPAPDGGLDMRVWERGSGLTMACGTGACATVVAHARTAGGARTADVRMPGGTVTVSWLQGGHVTLAGPATWVFDGELSTEWLARIDEEARTAR